MPATSPDITVSLVHRLVTSQFPQWADLPIRPVEIDGWDNRTFRLGDDKSIRLPSAERYSSQVTKEHQWLPYLAPRLPLPIPHPLVVGAPAFGYPWHWSIYQWIDGENATLESIADLHRFANDLARFLTALYAIDPSDGPPPGPHNFYRGAPLSVYDSETRHALNVLKDIVDVDAATTIWDSSLSTSWQNSPVWLHGDVSPSNLLVRDGLLSAVIDFGSSGVGDPACDLSIAWTLFAGESRKAFRSALSLDNDTWKRGRGWALWKALITAASTFDITSAQAKHSLAIINEAVNEA